MKRFLLSFCAAVLLEPLVIAASQPPSEEIARAIEELGAPQFEARQAATELLWRAGDAAEMKLRLAARSTDPEIRARAGELLNRLRLGIRPDTPLDVLAVIDQFRNAGTTDQKKQALRELAR